MNDDRSSRLREQRNQAREEVKQAETDEPEEQSEPSKPSEPAETDDRGETDEPSVKDEQVGRYLYLPEQQNRRIDQVYNKLKADYEFEYDEDLQKNRHYYPLLIQHGLEGLEGLDAPEVYAALDGMGIRE